MKFSAPIYQLKRRAKALSRERSIALNQALDLVALEEGFERWSLLASQWANRSPGSDVLGRLEAGDFVLLGARPGHGKTLLGLELVAQAVESGRPGAFFSLEFTDVQIRERLRSLGCDPEQFANQLYVDATDRICAEHIIERMSAAPGNAVVVIDYLQALDQRRSTPALGDQVRELKVFAASRKLVIVCISQIDRTYDSAQRSFPNISDVRLPNPVDLGLFSKTCFLHNGMIQINN